MNFGYFVRHTDPMKKHYWYFLIPPSGPALGSWRCWKMKSWGPGIQSFEAVVMNFGYFVQHTGPMKKHYWYFLIPPSGPASGSWRCWKMLSWGPGIQSFEAVIMNLGYFGQHTSPMKKHYGYVLIAPSGQASGPRTYWPYEKTLLVLFYTTLRASFRLMEMLENAVLRPCHPEFWSCYNEF